MFKYRLIIVQGTFQLLNALSILQSQKNYKEFNSCKDFLIIGGMCSNDLVFKSMTEICLQISQTWNFSKVYLFNNIEKLFEGNYCDFWTAIYLLKKSIKLQHVDVVYVCRNWQFINEVFLSAYPEALKICYGDGFGVLDLNSTLFTSNWEKNTLNPQGLNKVHEAHLIAPLEAQDKAFEECKIKIVDPKYFVDLVYESAVYVVGLKDYCKKILNPTGNPITVVLTSNCTEAGFVENLEQEIEFHLSCILPYIKEGETILVKGHPRQTLNQSKTLVDRLRKNGHIANEISSKFTCVPIELFVPFLPIAKAITCLSSSSVTLAYLCQCEIILGLGEKITKQYISPRFQKSILVDESCKKLQVQQAYCREFQLTRYSDLEGKTASFSRNPVQMKPNLNIIHRQEEDIFYEPKESHRELENIPKNRVYMFFKIFFLYRSIYVKIKRKCLNIFRQLSSKI